MSTTEQQPLLGILGGMGPLATVDFLGKLTRLTPASCDQEHLPWVTVSQPAIPDRSQAIQAQSDAPGIYLTKGVAYLAGQGVSLIAIPCNTSHFWYEAMQAASSAPILHIADAAIDELKRSPAPIGKVAILATRGTINTGIYGKPLLAQGFDVFPIDEATQTIVDGVIRQVKGGNLADAGTAMQQLADILAAASVGAVILGCTELPIAWQSVQSNLSAIDTSLALAKGCLRKLGYLGR